MRDFSPIAIVGRGCVVPGANDVRTLWTRILSGDDLTGTSQSIRWGLDPARICADRYEPSACARGGYVTGFASVWRSTGFALSPDVLAGVPAGWRWLIHACSQAVGEANIGLNARERTGLVLGSLGYPTREFADAAAHRWHGDRSLSAHSAALDGNTGALRCASDACGVRGPRVALDAACASGLYALKTACDLLNARRADVMLAAGLNAADDLFLHIGFTALSALSPSGRSAPLSTQADGLIPAEGAAVVALKRLDDAVAAGDRIFAVVRGVGLSNDGRGPGLLAPNTSGQQRAIHAAWTAARLDPSSLDYLECHATATPVGDREEIVSVRAVFSGARALRLGSLKSQMGHLITASATTGLLKLCCAFEAATFPPAPLLACAFPLPEITESGLALDRDAPRWKPVQRARRAAVNAFGFGGCNAHAILDGPEVVDELVTRHRPRRSAAAGIEAPTSEVSSTAVDLMIVACEMAIGEAANVASTLRVLTGRDAPTRRVRDVHLPLRGLGFPPADLQSALLPQLLLLRAALAIKPALDGFDHTRVGVFIGADIDPAGARHGYRWRLDRWLARPASGAERDAVVPALDAASVLGTMPNMPANRINSALDLGGAGVVLSDGERSGRWALSLAADAIARGELDAALVGAVDASGGAFGDDPTCADAAVLLFVVPANRLGNRPALACLTSSSADKPATAVVRVPWANTGVARDLVELGVAALCCHHGIRPDAPALPWVIPARTLSLHGWTLAGHQRRDAQSKGDAVADCARAESQTVALGGHRPPARFEAPQVRVLHAPRPPLLASVLSERLLVVDAPSFGPATPDSAVRAPRLLVALAETQASLLRAHEILVQQSGIRGARTVTATAYPGPKFTREDLEYLSHGIVSARFGPAFAAQDEYARQVRMPKPPLLLADRVLGIDAIPASMTTGTIWTETDVRSGAWYLHQGRMPAGILIESGQADLLLISWLGIDLTNRGERIYRLLGCEVTFAGRLPVVGETLHYAISIDGHARHGDVGLFFFHYDCTVGNDVRLRVREGQAGFFTDQELAESAGILWNPSDEVPDAAAPLAEPRAGVIVQAGYNEAAVSAFAAGDLVAAFGDAFVRTASHTRTPGIPAGRMQLFSTVDEIDPLGGPWKRGYLRASLAITPDSWFFAGHFHNDPCMPGTLMLEGCLQTMAFYLTAFGYTIDRDGWTFEPVPDQPYTLRCRGQVTPQSRVLTYEVFVSELHDGPEPTLVADLLCSVDGLKAFHCRRMALRLAPAFPLGVNDSATHHDDLATVAEYNGFRFGHASLLACATGDPTAAFGALYASLPVERRVPRLPAPPYHFISRVRALSHPPGGMQTGVTAETEYDIPSDAWYFAAQPSGRMPACVLIEVALQPCGWLASYVGCAIAEPHEVFFRNLDGAGVLHRPVTAGDASIVARATMRSLSRIAGMTLVTFDVTCTVGDELIYELTTSFGFFPKEALDGQTGLRATDDERAWAEQPATADLMSSLNAEALKHVPAPMLRMYDCVTHRDVAADGGARLRGEKAVHAEEWFFRAHFFQDPVQPGSLGVEALVQLLQAHLLLAGAADALPGGRFSDLVSRTPVSWQFRGQVLPEAQYVSLTLDAEPIERGPNAWSVRATGSVWVDGIRIYAVRDLSIAWEQTADTSTGSDTVLFDPDAEPWWNDHCPTYTIPVVPAMALVSRIVELPDSNGPVTVIERMTFRRWIALDHARAARIVRDGAGFEFTDAESGDVFADGTMTSGAYAPAPAPIPPLPADAPTLPDPYGSGSLFHGPAYQRMRLARRTSLGADARIGWNPDVDRRERVSHFVLDAALHAIPNDAMHEWFPEIVAGVVAYPVYLERFELYAEPPRMGESEVRARPDGLRGESPRFPRTRIQLLHDGVVWSEFVIVSMCLPAKGLSALSGSARRAFLRDGIFVAGARVSDEHAGVSRLTARMIDDVDWLPGTVNAVYGLAPDATGRVSTVEAVVAREHAAQRLAVHPRAINVDAHGTVRTDAFPLLEYRIEIGNDGDAITARDVAPPTLN